MNKILGGKIPHHRPRHNNRFGECRSGLSDPMKGELSYELIADDTNNRPVVSDCNSECKRSFGCAPIVMIRLEPDSGMIQRYY